jgi:hypothetical protein
LSVVLALEIETERLDRVKADILVTPFFACDRPLRGPAARADWRLCGMISDRLQREELTGELGEAALFPTGGRMRAPLLLAIGLGPRPDFGEETLRELARNAARRLLGLRSGVAGIALPGDTTSRIDTHRAVGILLEGASGLSTSELAIRLERSPGALPHRRANPATPAAAPSGKSAPPIASRR